MARQWRRGAVGLAIAAASCGRVGFAPGADEGLDADVRLDAAPRMPDAAASPATTYTWTELAPATSPGARARHAMTYDAGRQRVLLFGGTSGAISYAADLWSWDGATWTDVTPASSPPGRIDPALAYDAARDEVVLFGGVDATMALADTWVWDGVSWTERTPATSPPARYTPTLAYDPLRAATYLFGGSDGGYATPAFAETWRWDGATWTRLATAAESPSPRERHALAFDAQLRRTVTYGGVGEAGGFALDTWLWDGAAWSQLAVPNPGGRHSFALAYSPVHARTLLFGGTTTSGFDGETWAYDGVTWTTVVANGNGPSARDQTAMAFDATRGELVLYGGHTGPYEADTWILTP